MRLELWSEGGFPWGGGHCTQGMISEEGRKGLVRRDCEGAKWIGFVTLYNSYMHYTDLTPPDEPYEWRIGGLRAARGSERRASELRDRHIS